MQRFKIEFTKFTIVGIINSALTFIIFFLLLKVASVNYLVSLSITWIIGIIFSYVLNYLWVFRPDEKLEFQKRFAKYLSAYLVSFFLNFILIMAIVENWNFEPFYVQTGLLPIVVAFNFLTSKYWSLGTK
jgi:putative flippase GtrA